MTTWAQLSDNLKTDNTLQHLTEVQIQGIIDILTLAIHADDHVGFIEEMDFEHLLETLPWIENKASKVHGFRAEATEKAKSAKGEAGFKAVVESASASMTPLIQQRVFVMAVGLCAADEHLDSKESQALRWLGEVFGYGEDKISSLIEKGEHL